MAARGLKLRARASVSIAFNVALRASAWIETSILDAIQTRKDSRAPCVIQINRKMAYEIFPIAAGMVLRTAYEQALRLQLIKVNLWGSYNQTLHKDSFPTLRSI